MAKPTRLAPPVTKAFGNAVRAPELAERLGAMGFVPAGEGPAAYAATIARETERFGRIIRAGNIRPD